MPDGQVRGMPSPTRSATSTGSGIVLPHRLYNPLGTEVYSDEFDGATIDPGWTRVEGGGTSGHATWTQASSMMTFKHNSSTETGPAGHYLLRDISSLGGPPLTIEVRARGLVARNTSYLMMGMAFTDGTTWSSGKQIIWMPYVHGSSGSGMAMSIRELTGFTAQNSQWGGMIAMTPYAPGYYRLVWESTNNWRGYWSTDGINWLNSGTHNWTCAATHAGFYISNWSQSQWHTVAYDYIRIYDTDPPEGEVNDTL